MNKLHRNQKISIPPVFSSFQLFPFFYSPNKRDEHFSISNNAQPSVFCKLLAFCKYPGPKGPAFINPLEGGRALDSLCKDSTICPSHGPTTDCGTQLFQKKHEHRIFRWATCRSLPESDMPSRLWQADTALCCILQSDSNARTPRESFSDLVHRARFWNLNKQVINVSCPLFCPGPPTPPRILHQRWWPPCTSHQNNGYPDDWRRKGRGCRNNQPKGPLRAYPVGCIISAFPARKERYCQCLSGLQNVPAPNQRWPAHPQDSKASWDLRKTFFPQSW